MKFKKTVTKEEEREVVEKLRESFKSAEGACTPRKHTVPDKFVVRIFLVWALTLYPTGNSLKKQKSCTEV